MKMPIVRNAGSLVAAGALTLVCAVAAQAQDGWTIPQAAASEKSPFAASREEAAKKGKSVFQRNCQRCHGPEGKGNGPEADPKAPPANLAQVKADETDGVLFYKVWNGHEPTAKAMGKMPAFKTRITKEEAWQAVEYVRTLHKFFF